MKSLIDFILSLLRRQTPEQTTPVEPQAADPSRLVTPISSAASWPLVPTSTARRSPQMPRHTKKAFIRYGVTDVLPIAFLLPQVAHESKNFTATRANLGPTPAQFAIRRQPQSRIRNRDGRRFAGLFEIS